MISIMTIFLGIKVFLIALAHVAEENDRTVELKPVKTTNLPAFFSKNVISKKIRNFQTIYDKVMRFFLFFSDSSYNKRLARFSFLPFVFQYFSIHFSNFIIFKNTFFERILRREQLFHFPHRLVKIGRFVAFFNWLQFYGPIIFFGNVHQGY